jgi:small-conductance mechanosensitive channel
MTDAGILILIALARFLVGAGLVWLALRILGGWLRRLTRATASSTDDRLLHAVLRTAAPLGYLGAFLWSWHSLVSDWDGLTFNSGIDRFIEGLVLLIAIVLIVRLANKVLLLVLDRSLRKIGQEQQISLLQGLEPMIRTVLWLLGILVFLQNQGVQMGAIYASLAGAGIGVGLALKGPISNFLNYLTILLDEPFQIGDFIRFDDYLGTVETVGIRSSVIRSLSGERIVIGNEELLNKTIRNYGDLPRRRVANTIGVTYQTPPETVREIPAIVAEAIRAHPPAEFDRCHFTRFADSALEFEFVFFVPDGDIVKFLDLQQAINLSIMQAFAGRSIDFAYPTRTLFLEGAAPAASAG